jgi:hypothetical protein
LLAVGPYFEISDERILSATGPFVSKCSNSSSSIIFNIGLAGGAAEMLILACQVLQGVPSEAFETNSEIGDQTEKSKQIAATQVNPLPFPHPPSTGNSLALTPAAASPCVVNLSS